MTQSCLSRGRQSQGWPGTTVRRWHTLGRRATEVAVLDWESPLQTLIPIEHCNDRIEVDWGRVLPIVKDWRTCY
jgi:hypothetical protein